MARELLPTRRMSETLEFTHDGVPYRATVGYYNDGRPGEVFLNGGKLSSAADIAARDGAIACSFALQHGVEPSTITKAFTRDAMGQPEGALGALFDLLAGGV